jgi:hypothetical protein
VASSRGLEPWRRPLRARRRRRRRRRRGSSLLLFLLFFLFLFRRRRRRPERAGEQAEDLVVGPRDAPPFRPLPFVLLVLRGGRRRCRIPLPLLLLRLRHSPQRRPERRHPRARRERQRERSRRGSRNVVMPPSCCCCSSSSFSPLALFFPFQIHQEAVEDRQARGERVRGGVLLGGGRGRSDGERPARLVGQGQEHARGPQEDDAVVVDLVLLADMLGVEGAEAARRLRRKRGVHLCFLHPLKEAREADEGGRPVASVDGEK